MPSNKKKSRNRSSAVVFCGTCQKKLGGGKLLCVCTKVNFCNETCLRLGIQSGQHLCDGAPSSNKVMRPGQNGASPLDDADIRTQWQRQYDETIRKPFQAAMLVEGMRAGGIPENPGADFYAQIADRQGSGPAAYMAGIHYKNRLLQNVRSDRRGGVRADNNRRGGDGVLDTDELAFKYLLQAAESGIGIAMDSLAELYIHGKGVRERRITGNDWFWHAVLLNSAGSIDLLDSHALIPLELNAMSDVLDQALAMLAPGQAFNGGGPVESARLVVIE